MRKSIPFAAILLFYSNFSIRAQNQGEGLFKATCAACHTIHKGRLVGPDLSGVYQRRSGDWLFRFISSSQKLVKEGDSTAVGLYNRHNRIPMPDNNLSQEQINSIIGYIQETDRQFSASTPAAAPTTDSTGLQYTQKLAPEGRALFYGYARFSNGASPCIDCHNINDQSALGGGKLALDLTGAYTKLGAEGIKAILNNPPFPVMQTALRDHQLKDHEIVAIISLFKSISERPGTYRAASTGGLFFIMISFVCALFILVHIYILYDNRKIT
jgi:mono/diheme cytochrome c family protein